MTERADTGLSYDTWGNITTLPAADSDADSGGAGGTTIGYYADNTVRSQNRGLAAGGTRTLTWTRDAAGRRLAQTDSTTSTTTTNEYDGPSGDSPASTTTGTSTWTRNITGLDGMMAVTLDQGGTLTWSIQDLHGDTAGTLANGATTMTVYAGGTDSFGVPADNTTRTYQYEGAHERSGGDEAGLILMGARLYDPALGRFLETDPVFGGSANTYDYANQDPVDNNDLSGQCIWCHVKHFIAKHHVAGILAGASTLVGFFPGAGGISIALGGLSVATYAATGDYAAAKRELISTAVSGLFSYIGGRAAEGALKGLKDYAQRRVAIGFAASAASTSISLTGICGDSLGCGSPVSGPSLSDPETRVRLGGGYAQ